MAPRPDRRVHLRRIKFYLEVIEEAEEWARWRFRLLFGSKNGDLLPFINELIKSGKKVKDEDIEPEISELSASYIELFFEINRWRGASGMGVSPLTFADIDGYCRYYYCVLQSFEVKLLKNIDEIFLIEANKKQDG